MSKYQNKLKQVVSLTHKYYVLRHGQSMANVEGIISSDPKISTITHGLSEEGRRQAGAALSTFSTLLPDSGAEEKKHYVAIFTSDFLRAHETAKIFAGSLTEGGSSSPYRLLTGSPTIETALRERFFGDLNGKTDKFYQGVWDGDAKSADHEVDNVESVSSVLSRTTGVVTTIDAQLPPTPDGSAWHVVLVAHGDVLQILQTGFARWDPRQHRSLPHLETASIKALILKEESSKL